MFVYLQIGNTATVSERTAPAHARVTWFQDLIWTQNTRFEKTANDRNMAKPYCCVENALPSLSTAPPIV